MKTLSCLARFISDSLNDSLKCSGRFIWGRQGAVCLTDLLHGTGLGGHLPELSGKSILLLCHDQLAAALAMIELDGVARRMIICPPDLQSEHVPVLMSRADVDVVVSDYSPPHAGGLSIPLVRAGLSVIARRDSEVCRRTTEWILLTSGTSGLPKMVAHTLESLTAAIKGDQHQGTDVVWGTFYDIRRYGGLQIFLRFLLGRGSMVLSASDESAGEHLGRLALRSVTHLTGTPSHWRRALMSPSVRDIAPRYIRLSGEIVDQAVLNSLRSTFPKAAIGHVFASTEAGVCFEVKDRMDGFPSSFVGPNDGVDIKIDNRCLKVRSPGTATRYIGEEDSALRDSEGFVDTGDAVELRGNRFYFLGRQTGIINVGGLKVHPEEIESLLNKHHAIRMSRVRSQRNPITGSLVVAEIVLKPDTDTDAAHIAQLKAEILEMCREMLPRHKVPATLNVVTSIDVAASGKVARNA